MKFRIVILHSDINDHYNTRVNNSASTKGIGYVGEEDEHFFREITNSTHFELSNELNFEHSADFIRAQTGFLTICSLIN